MEKKLQEKHPKTMHYETNLTRTGQSDAHQVSKRTAGRSVPPPPPQDPRVSLPRVTDPRCGRGRSLASTPFLPLTTQLDLAVDLRITH